MQIEIAIEDASHALKAEQLGATRIELCANLAEGGLTPSVGLARATVLQTKLPVYAMLRPRTGNFTYTDLEIEQILFDLEALSFTGIKGIVFGALTEDAYIDEKLVTMLKQKSQESGLGFTFHRAIDACKKPMEAIDFLSNIGVEQILTSGGATTAPQGIFLIEEFIKRAAGKLDVVAGSGINAKNILPLWDAGVRSFHCTAQRVFQNPDRHKLTALGFAKEFHFDEVKVDQLVRTLTQMQMLE